MGNLESLKHDLWPRPLTPVTPPSGARMEPIESYCEWVWRA
jgi:hypothetical protein